MQKMAPIRVLFLEDVLHLFIHTLADESEVGQCLPRWGFAQDSFIVEADIKAVLAVGMGDLVPNVLYVVLGEEPDCLCEDFRENL